MDIQLPKTRSKIPMDRQLTDGESLQAGCLPYAVGKKPSINVGSSSSSSSSLFYDEPAPSGLFIIR